MPNRRETLIGSLAVGAAIAAPAIGRAADRRAAFLEEIPRLMKARGAPGAAVALVEDGKVTLAQGFGVRNVEGSDAVDADTLFRIGSVAKPFTTLTALRLADAGKLDLDAPVSRALPEFKADDRVTMRHLLSHTSGLADATPARPDIGAGAAKAYVTEMRALAWDPGRWFSYSNPGYATAGALIEAAGGAPFEAQAAKTIEALGLEHSTFDIGQLLTRPHTVPHRLEKGRALVVRPEPFAQFRHDAAAGMMFSSARELGRFATWLLQGPGGAGAVSAAAFAQMKRPHSTLAPIERSYGLGLGLDRIRGDLVLGHGGSIWGHESALQTVPARGFAIVVMTNVQDSGLESAVVDHALEKLAGLPAVTPRPAQRRAEHLGVYLRRRHDGEMTRREVVAAGDGVAIRSPNGTVNEVQPPFRPDVYGRPGRYMVFLRDASGRVAGVNGSGRFALKET